MRKSVSLLVCLALLSVACDGDSTASRVQSERSPEPQVRSTPAPVKTPAPARGERGASVPPRSKVVFHELGKAGPAIRTAIADLKRIGVWNELTGHLHEVDIRVKDGRASVAKDHHLADARFWRLPIAYGTFDYPRGVFCRIRFFPTAMRDDIYRWLSYYEQGLTGRAPPTMRQFWASIMGHELFHCPAHGLKTRPEPGALAWEARILARLMAAGVE